MQFKKGRIIFGALMLVCFLASCATKEVNMDDSKEAYSQIRSWYYDETLYDEAIQKYNEFRSKYPYSKYSIEAELDIANAYFQQEKWPEASVSYEEFIKLHPKHPQLAFVLYRNAQCYFNQRNSVISRDQLPTEEAMFKFKIYLDKFPQGKYVKEATQHYRECKRDLATHEKFIGDFYLRQNHFFAALLRYKKIIALYRDIPGIHEASLYEAISCFSKLVQHKKKAPESDKNYFLANMQLADLRGEGRKLGRLYVEEYKSGKYLTTVRQLMKQFF